MGLLSERLQAIADMVTPDLTVADIGCDHAYLSIYLAKNNIATYVYACDINEGPVRIAQNNIEEAGLTDKITVRKGSGLKAIKPGEAQSIVIAGMGGRLMMDIITEGEAELKGVHELVLGPQSEVSVFRHFLEEKGFCIVSESFVFEDDKFYPIIKARFGSMNLLDEVYYRYGRIPIREENPVLHQFLIKERDYFKGLIERLSESKTEGANARIAEIKENLYICERALQIISSKSYLEHDRKLT